MSFEESDDKFRFNPADCQPKTVKYTIQELTGPEFVLSLSLGDIDVLASYLKVLYRSTAYVENSLNDHSGYNVNQGGDNGLVGLALETLNDIRDRVLQARQALKEEH